MTFKVPEGVDVTQNNDKTTTEAGQTTTEGDATPVASTTEPEVPATENADASTGRHLQQDEHTRNLQSIPLSWDWRSKGAVGPVKNQGSCGACWAFATVGNLEGLYYRKYGVLKNFSEQHLLDCSTANYGCNGGFFEKAMSYIRNAGGIQQTGDYGSYKAYRKTCSFNRSKATAQVKSWTFVGSNEVTIKNYLYNNGPIAVALNANTLQYYRGGVVNVSCSRAVNHGVTLVGYGSANGMDYWIVKNSWGANWGEKGFFRIRRGVGMCGINSYVVSAVLA
jgi:cathepsin F